jgi:Kef-type K+ transport system membrane component KefB
MPGRTAHVLSSLGSDVSFSIAFSIASELNRLASNDMQDDELIAVVITILVLHVLAISFLSGRVPTEKRSILSFVLSVLNLSLRITVSLAVQLIASALRSSSSYSVVSVMTLMTTCVVFVFLQHISELSVMTATTAGDAGKVT